MRKRPLHRRVIASFVRLVACTVLLVVIFGWVRFWVAMSVALVSAAVLIVSYLPLRRYDRIYECVHCGYDLRGTKGTCPECGKLIPPGAPHGVTH